MELYSYSHAHGQSAYHFVFCPKYRYAIFEDAFLRFACVQIFKRIAEQYGMRIYAIEVMPDHVHLFVELPHTISVAKAAQILKGISSRLLRKMYPQIREKLRKQLWSDGYFFRSVGNVTADTIAHYIRTSQRNF